MIVKALILSVAYVSAQAAASAVSSTKPRTMVGGGEAIFPWQVSNGLIIRTTSPPSVGPTSIDGAEPPSLSPMSDIYPQSTQKALVSDAESAGDSTSPLDSGTPASEVPISPTGSSTKPQTRVGEGEPIFPWQVSNGLIIRSTSAVSLTGSAAPMNSEEIVSTSDLSGAVQQVTETALAASSENTAIPAGLTTMLAGEDGVDTVVSFQTVTTDPDSGAEPTEILGDGPETMMSPETASAISPGETNAVASDIMATLMSTLELLVSSEVAQGAQDAQETVQDKVTVSVLATNFVTLYRGPVRTQLQTDTRTVTAVNTLPITVGSTASVFATKTQTMVATVTETTTFTEGETETKMSTVTRTCPAVTVAKTVYISRGSSQRTWRRWY